MNPLEMKITKDMDCKKFMYYEWDKQELVRFCDEVGIARSASKLELKRRILVYLESGKITHPANKRGPRGRDCLKYSTLFEIADLCKTPGDARFIASYIMNN